MKDIKDFDKNIDNNDGEENKKLVDRFLTPKAVPDKDKQRLHFEKMLEAIRKPEAENNSGTVQLSDDELDFVAAAGTVRPIYTKCPICGKSFPEDSMDEHVDSIHRK